MERIAEPELMEQEEQVKAYALADFDEPHEQFLTLLKQNFKELSGSRSFEGVVLDLGCGAGDIMRRFVRDFPGARVHGVDGSATMLRWAAELSRDAVGRDRLKWIHGFIGQASYPYKHYDAVISNSLLHHLNDPQDLWDCVKKRAVKGAPVFVMDLMRPDSTKMAEDLCNTYCANEPDILKRDFYNSLLAAYGVEELEHQLQQAGLGCLSVNVCSDRHLTISGYMSA